MRRLKRRDEHGAAAVLVAILVPLILTGIGFLAVSIGGWYSARAMDQNAADAGAIAVAQTCSPGPCDPTAADDYADGSSNGTLAGQVSTVCGSSLPGLTSCSSLGVAENGVACPLPSSGAYVDVLTAPSGGSMNNLFGGGSQPLGACAQASVGAPTGCSGCTALTISKCEWDLDTNKGSNFATTPSGGANYGAPGPQYTSPPSYFDTITQRRNDTVHYQVSGANLYVADKIYDPRNPKVGYTSTPSAPSNATIYGSETVLTTHGFGPSCDGASGNTAGQFGWLSNGSCSVIVSDPYPGSTGNSSAPCEAAFTASRDNATPIYLPVYGSATGTGAGVSYSLDGFAAFVVTGWDVTSGNANNFTVKKAPSLVAQADTGLPSGTSANYCGTYTGSPSDVCLYGYFTKALTSAAELTGSGGTPLGLSVAALSG